MSTITTLLARTAALSALVAVPMAIVQPASAAPASRCPKAPKQVGVKELGRGNGYAYAKRGALYGCGRTASGALRARKLGPWSPQSKVIVHEGRVTWTVRRTPTSGIPEDRIWAAGLDGESRVRGVAAALEPSDRIVSALLPGSMWVTVGGTVAVASPSIESPSPVGDGTPGAAAIGDATGLSTTLKPVGPRLELGRWGAAAVPSLVATAKLVYSDPGLSDGCAGVNQYTATVVPVIDQPPVGATWLETIYSTSEGC